MKKSFSWFNLTSVTLGFAFLYIPILLLVNGNAHFKRPDGTAVVFKDFPAGAGNPLGLNGSWSVADFEAAVKAALGQ